MATKTLGTVLIIIVCILLFPVGIAIIASVFGIVFGALGAVLGAVFGVIGGLFGAIFGTIGDIFDWDFRHGFFDLDIFSLAAIVLLIVLLSRRNQAQTKK